MKENPPPDARSGRSLLRIALPYIILATLFVGLVGGFVWVAGSNWRETQSRVMADFEVLIKAGYPTSTSEERSKLAPGTTNADPDLIQASKMGVASPWRASTPVTESTWASWKTKNLPWIMLVERASQADVYVSADFPASPGLPEAASLGELQKAGRFLALDAAFEGAKGNRQQALKRFRQAVRLAELACNLQDIPGHRASAGILEVAYRAAEILGTELRADPPALKELRRVIGESQGPETDLAGPLKGEFARSMDHIRMMADVDGFDPNAKPRVGPPSVGRELTLAEPLVRWHVQALELAQDVTLDPSDIGRKQEELIDAVEHKGVQFNFRWGEEAPYASVGRKIEDTRAKKMAILALLDLLIKTPPDSPFPRQLPPAPTFRSGRTVYGYSRAPNGLVVTPRLFGVGAKHPLNLLPSDRDCYRYPRNFSPAILRLDR